LDGAAAVVPQTGVRNNNPTLRGIVAIDLTRRARRGGDTAGLRRVNGLNPFTTLPDFDHTILHLPTLDPPVCMFRQAAPWSSGVLANLSGTACNLNGAPGILDGRCSGYVDDVTH